MFELKTQENRARRGAFTTPHGTVQTPAFMNVATQAAIKGGLSAYDLERLGTQVALCNTYHLHIRPGDALIRDMGGLHRFMTWSGPILTDSGGFQVFSLASLRRIKEEGVFSTPMWTARGSSWARRRVCASSQIWAAMSPWPLTSA